MSSRKNGTCFADVWSSFVTKLAMLTLVVGLLIGPAANTIDAQEEWTTDAAAALKLADEKNRDMLLLFTGSDWCTPVSNLKKRFSEKRIF